MQVYKPEQKKTDLPSDSAKRPLSDLGSAIVNNYNAAVRKAKLSGCSKLLYGKGSGEMDLTAWDSTVSARMTAFLKKIDEYRDPLYYMTINRSTGFEVLVNRDLSNKQSKRIDRDISAMLTLVAFQTHPLLFSNLYECYEKISLLHDFVYDKNCANKIVTIDFPIENIDVK